MTDQTEILEGLRNDDLLKWAEAAVAAKKLAENESLTIDVLRELVARREEMAPFPGNDRYLVTEGHAALDALSKAASHQELPEGEILSPILDTLAGPPGNPDSRYDDDITRRYCAAIFINRMASQKLSQTTLERLAWVMGTQEVKEKRDAQGRQIPGPDGQPEMDYILLDGDPDFEADRLVANGFENGAELQDFEGPIMDRLIDVSHRGRSHTAPTITKTLKIYGASHPLPDRILNKWGAWLKHGIDSVKGSGLSHLHSVAGANTFSDEILADAASLLGSEEEVFEFAEFQPLGAVAEQFLVKYGQNHPAEVWAAVGAVAQAAEGPENQALSERASRILEVVKPPQRKLKQ